MEQIHLEILQIVQKSSSPPGWYNIEIGLSMKGIVPKKALPLLLAELTDSGLIDCDRESGTHGTYSLTEEGEQFLEHNGL